MEPKTDEQKFYEDQPFRTVWRFTIPETFMAVVILLAIGFGIGIGLVFNLTDSAYKSVVAPVATKGEAISERLTTIEVELGIKRRNGELPPPTPKNVRPK